MARLADEAGLDKNLLAQLKKNNQITDFSKEFEILKFVQGFYQYYLLNTKEGRFACDYLTSRGITKEIIQQFGIGLAPNDGNLLITALTSNSFSFEIAKNVGIIAQSENGDYYSQFKARIMFAVTCEQGNVCGFSGRTYLASDEHYAKYMNSPASQVFQKSQIIYNLYVAKKIARTTGKILMFEGFLDVITAHTAGFAASVATMGTALTAEHAKILSRHAREVTLVFDGDSAGVQAAAKAIPILLATGIQVKVASIPNALDPDEYIKQNGANKFADIINGALGAIDYQYNYLKQGLRLETTDGQVEFERRLTNFGKLVPNQATSAAMHRKWKNEVYESRQRQKRQPHYQQGSNWRSHGKQIFTTPMPMLQVIEGTVKAEKELIYYMLIEKAVFELVSSQIGVAFNIDAHRKIVQAIEAYYFQNSKMEPAEFLASLEPASRQIVQNVLDELANLTKNWSESVIIELVGKVKKGALKLERAGKKQMFYKASHEQQLVMMGDLTASFVN